jgi:hypothetical protein
MGQIYYPNSVAMGWVAQEMYNDNMQTSEDNKSSDNVPLISAYAGDMNFVVPFLRDGGPVSYRNSEGDTMLHAAAMGW